MAPSVRALALCNRLDQVVAVKMLSPRALGWLPTKSLPMMKACASPSGLGWTAY